MKTANNKKKKIVFSGSISLEAIELLGIFFFFLNWNHVVKEKHLLDEKKICLDLKISVNVF